MIRAGQKLRDERQNRGLSLSDVSSATKIRVEFLEAIEKGEYEKLPSPSYAHGFVKNYTRFLKLPEKEILPLFRREFDSEKTYQVLPEGLVGQKEMPLKRFKIKQATILVAFIFILLLGFIIFKYRYVFINPPITLSNPSEMSVLSSSTILVLGKTDPNSTITVNDEQVSVGSDGTFKKEITGFPGKTTITIKAVNRFGKQTTLTRHVVIK